jgi:hypothetical protein
MSFSRHREIYPCGEDNSVETKSGATADRKGAILANHALAHRNDESPAGYSSAGCSPAVPASASPAGTIILGLDPHAKDFAANGKLSLFTVSQRWGSLQTVPNYCVPAMGFTPVVELIGYNIQVTVTIQVEVDGRARRQGTQDRELSHVPFTLRPDEIRPIAIRIKPRDHGLVVAPGVRPPAGIRCSGKSFQHHSRAANLCRSGSSTPCPR